MTKHDKILIALEKHINWLKRQIQRFPEAASLQYKLDTAELMFDLARKAAEDD